MLEATPLESFSCAAEHGRRTIYDVTVHTTTHRIHNLCRRAGPGEQHRRTRLKMSDPPSLAGADRSGGVRPGKRVVHRGQQGAVVVSSVGTHASGDRAHGAKIVCTAFGGQAGYPVDGVYH